jgi:cobalt-zinc-cadmium efflux system outer membrane protein
MKRAQLADRERRLRAEVRLKAGEMLAAARNVQVTGELLEVNRTGLGLLQERVRTGAIPPLEGNLMQVEVNRLDASRQVLESRLEVLRLQLRALAGLAPDSPLAVRGALESSDVPMDRDVGGRRALAARPDLEAARTDVALAQARVRKEEADGRWDASVNVGYQRQETGFGLNGITDRGGTRPIQDVFHMVGGGVTITLPVRNRNQGNVQAALAEVRAAERRREFLELQVRQEVAAAFTQNEVARRSLALYARGVRDLAQQNLDVVRQSHGLGRIQLLEVIAEQRRYIEIEIGYTDALKQAWDGAVEIERALGVALR